MSSRRDFLKASAVTLPAVAALPTTLTGETAQPKLATAPALPPTKTVSTPTQLAMGAVTAKVSQRLLTKADRLFDGNVRGRITELLQNARRAGATRVDIRLTRLPDVSDGGGQSSQRFEIELIDDGHGLTDFGQLLSLGFSGWGDDIEAAEDPAGAGFFSLAPRAVTVASRGREITITREGWLGMPIHVEPSDFQGTGLRLRFEDTPWSSHAVQEAAEFGPLAVTLDGEEIKHRELLSPKLPVTHWPDLGVKVQLIHQDELEHLVGSKVTLIHYGGSRSVLNFHGQMLVSSDFDRSILAARNWHRLIELTGEPTMLRMVLPARNALVENEAYKELGLRLEKLAFSRIKAPHRLHYDHWRRARQLGFQLPESEVVLGSSTPGWPSHPEISFDFSQPLDKPLVVDEVDSHESRNIVMVAEDHPSFPFHPTSVPGGYTPYKWAKRLRRLTKVKPIPGEKILEEYVSFGKLTVVESLEVEVTIGKRRKRFPMRIACSDADDEHAYITPDGLFELADDAIWACIGGQSEDSDQGWERQEHDLEEELQSMRNRLLGPNEHRRAELEREVHEFLQSVGHKQHYESLTFLPDGTVQVLIEDGETITVAKSERKKDATA